MRQDQSAVPKVISMLGLVDEFRHFHKTMQDRRFAFVLGAGASKSSGIKLASEMVVDWINQLHRASASAQGQAESEWANAANLKIAEFDPLNPAASYSALYQRMYEDDTDKG
jgi:protein O-mannosyl-transferase